MTDLSRREKEAGVVPDPDIDTYMKVVLTSIVFISSLLSYKDCLMYLLDTVCFLLICSSKMPGKSFLHSSAINVVIDFNLLNQISSYRRFLLKDKRKTFRQIIF